MAPHQDRETISTPALSLYARLGGAPGIATGGDALLDRMEVNPVLHANPAIANAYQRATRAMRRYLVTALLGWATGGPQPGQAPCAHTGW